MSVKRNDLYHALHDTAKSFGAQFHFGTQLESILNTTENGENKLSAMFVDKDGHCSSEICSLLIGSDGVHSSVRKDMFDEVVASRHRDSNSLAAGKYPDSCVILEHKLAYREISIPSRHVVESSVSLEMDTFHIWGSSGTCNDQSLSLVVDTFELRCEKICLWGFPSGQAQTGLYSHR